jgi:hypothetical protein
LQRRLGNALESVTVPLATRPNFCVYPHGFDRGQRVRLTVEQKETLHMVFDTDESPEVTGPLAAYLALFFIAGPRDLAAHVSAIPLGAEVFSTWNAVGPDLRAVLKRDGATIICPELGTKFPPVAA